MEEEANESTIQEFMRGYANVADFIEDGKKSVVDGIRASNCFPTGLARDKFNTYPSFSRVVQSMDDLVTRISDKLMKLENGVRNIYVPDEEQRFNALEEVNDMILERCSFKSDAIAGHLRRAPGMTETDLNHHKQQSSSSAPVISHDIQKPQLNFKVPIDNSNSLWKPIITNKPNSLQELAIREVYDANDICVGYEHPYKYEIDSFEPLELVFSHRNDDFTFKSLESTPLKIVDTKDKLDDLLTELENVSEIAVDLEHNDRRSYQGITCLMQISTDKTDYILDVFPLNEHVYLLNKYFTNPNILKVFHGANSDILWLQRDFGVYVVGMFDTYQAAQELNHAQKSLAALIRRYCNVEMDKRYQRADWRVRPIPERMMEYARMDTHYLLYIRRQMYKDLLSLGYGSYERLKSVFDASKNVCLLTYQKRQLRENSYQELLIRTIGKIFNYRQTLALKCLYEWRDAVARKEDESVDFVLPNHMLLSLAEILPREKEGILEICLPKPALLFQYLQDIHSIILSSKVASVSEATARNNISAASKSLVLKRPQKDSNNFENLCKEDLKLITLIKASPKWDVTAFHNGNAFETNQKGRFQYEQRQDDDNTFKDFPIQLKFM